MRLGRSTAIVGMQELEQSAQGERTVADAVFLRRRQFGSRLSARKQEQRVVAKSIHAARRARDLAAPDALGDERLRVVGPADEDHCAVVMRRALGTELGEQLRVVAPVALIAAAFASGKVSGVDARLA